MAEGSKASIVLAGASSAGRGTPWGTLCEIVKRAIEPLGYQCTIEPRSWGEANGRWVADGRAALGAWHNSHLINAYEGLGGFAEDGPFTSLRVIANVNHSAWLAVAVRRGSGIAELSDCLKKPTRIRRGHGRAINMLLDHYGLSPEAVSAAGGSLLGSHDPTGPVESAPIIEPELVPWVSKGDFDVIIDSLYSGFAPELPHWPQAAIEHDLDFLPLDEVVVQKITQARMGVPGAIPHRLLRGIWADVPSILRLPQAIYCRNDTDETLVTDVASALYANRHLFRECHLNYSYDVANVAQHFGVPFHPAALAFYESVGLQVP